MAKRSRKPRTGQQPIKQTSRVGRGRRQATPDERYHRAKARVPQLQQKLIDFALGGRFQAVLDRAWHQFSTSPRAFWALPAGDVRAISFLDWFIRDYRLADGRRPIAVFLKEHGTTLSPVERSLVEEWQESRFGIYEVQEIRPGEGVTVRDVFTDDAWSVRDVTLSKQALRWDLFAGRIITVAGVHELSGTGAVIPRWVRSDVIELAERELAAYRADHQEASWSAFLRDRSYLFNRFVEDLSRRPAPSLITAEGDPICFAQAEYGLLDRSAIVRTLGGLFEQVSKPTDPAIVYAWIGPAPGQLEQPSDRGRAIVVESQLIENGETKLNLGTVTVENDRLLLDCMSGERLTRGRALLESALGGAVVHREDRIKSVDEVMANVPDRPQGEALQPEMSADLAARVAYEHWEQHYEAWIDRPLPLLDGKTPRQAAETPAGRTALEALLRDLENAEDRKQRQGQPAYDVNRLRRRLGLATDEAGQLQASQDQQAKAEAAIQPVLAVFGALIENDLSDIGRHLAPEQPAAVALELFGVEGLAFSAGLHLPAEGFGVRRGEFGDDEVRLELFRTVQTETGSFELLMTVHVIQADGGWRLAYVVPWGLDQSCGDDPPPDRDLADLLTGDAQLNVRPGAGRDDVERILLATAGQTGLNYLEQVNAIRAWRAYRRNAPAGVAPTAWAAGAHFVVVQLGYIDQSPADLATAYGVDLVTVEQRAKLIEQGLGIGQLDERYSLPSAITTLIRTTDLRPPVLGLPLGAEPNGKSKGS